MEMEDSIRKEYLSNVIQDFKNLKKFTEKALAQLKPNDYHWQPDEESNSIAIIIKHLSGNMISRWTDFLTTDGEKPERNRDIEFVMLPDMTKDDMLAYWERGWQCVFEAVGPLKPDDLMRTIRVRGQDHTVVQAINRQLAHYAYHVGQIVFLAKHFKSSEWQNLSVPKNRSAEFNARLQNRE